MIIKYLSLVSLSLCCSYASALVFDFGYTGKEETFIVPEGVSRLYVQLWGAGGGISGGSGAYVDGHLSVTQGQSLSIVVGQASGGVYYNEGIAGRNFGGGGYAHGFSDVLAGNGGGMSALFVDGSLVAVAGGGGGGTRVTIGAWNTRCGGGGGTYVGGLPGNNPNVGTATGGTQTSGGSVNGGYLHGGDPIGPGAGGGGGYYGGGGGTNSNYYQYSIFPGAGGSSFWQGLTDPTFLAGQTGSVNSNVLPGGSSVTNYEAGTGIGGYGNGGHGRLVLTSEQPSVPGPSALATFTIGVIVRMRRRSQSIGSHRKIGQQP